MPSRRDSSSKRLFQLFEQSQLPRELGQRFFEEDFLKPAGTSLDQLFDFNNDLIYLAISRSALHLNEGNEKDTRLLAAFKAAGLDHRNPRHWRELLSMFAEVHFGRTKTKPQKWNPVALSEVFRDYLVVKAENPAAKGAQLREFLRKDKRFKEKYAKYNIDAFRKLLRQALNPKVNVLLQHSDMRDPLLQLIRNDYEQKGTAWTPHLESLIKGLLGRFLKARYLKDKV